MILDQPWQIELYRLGVLKQRLILEMQGLTFKQGSMTTLQVVNDTLLRNGRVEKPLRTKKDAFDALQEYVEAKVQEAIAEGLM